LGPKVSNVNMNTNIYLCLFGLNANESWTAKKLKHAPIKHTQHIILGHYAHLQNSTHDQITMSNKKYCCFVIQHVDLPWIKNIISRKHHMWALGDITTY
jgi:hypothetical protein